MYYSARVSTAFRQRGLSLVDLLITLSISAVMASASIELIDSKDSAEAKAFTHIVVRQMQLARAIAIDTGREITVCGSSNAQECSKTWDETTELMVFYDRNGDRSLDTDDELLLMQPLVGGEVAWSASGGRKYLRYRSDGSVKEFGALIWCPTSGDPTHARMVTINRVGRPYVSRDRDGDGRHNSNRDPSTNIECPT